MKKWEYKVMCYTYDEENSSWVSIFDSVERKTIEELILPLGEQGWELISVAAELAVPLQYTTMIPTNFSRAGGNGGGGFLERIRSLSNEPVSNAGAIPSSHSGGFDVKTYRAFFKRKKRGGLF
jgi:hypothetical protein